MTVTQTFSADVYAHRLQAAQQAAADKGIDLLLIGTGPDFAYLTGSWVSSHERLTVLVVPQRGNAWIAAPNTDITDIKAAPVGELDVELRGWDDGENPYELALRGAGDELGKVALGQSLTADHVLRFQDLLPHASYELATYALAELFTRKDEAEIAELRKAGRAIDAVHGQVPQLMQAGRTEAEVAHKLEKLILREHSVIDFVIVGSGPNGANPHHSFSDRVLAEGEPVVVDIGGTLPSGYHSDCTRTYVEEATSLRPRRTFRMLMPCLLTPKPPAELQPTPATPLQTSMPSPARRSLLRGGVTTLSTALAMALAYLRTKSHSLWKAMT